VAGIDSRRRRGCSTVGERVGGKVCIVTGAGSGIGRASAIRLAEEGARVTCIDLREDAVRSTAEEIGDAAFAVAADVSDDGQVRAYTDGTVERWGTLDVVFNNAGVNLPTVFHEATDELIDRTLSVNVKGTIHGCRAAIPHMLKAGGGSIVNTGSVNSIVSEPYLSIYAA
jgi:dihydroanticapsin dehydrogenase